MSGSMAVDGVVERMDPPTGAAAPDGRRAASEPAPGPWLRLTAMGGAAAAALAVASGALSLTVGHYLLAVLAVPPLAAVFLAALVCHRRLLVPAAAALAMFFCESVVGAAIPLAGRTTWATALHITFAALAFAAALVSAALTLRGVPAGRGSVRDYITLTKPRIMSLLLLTAACGTFAGAHGLPNLGRLCVVLVGGALASGGASALNHYLDRDIDGLMGGRTAGRPLAAGRLEPPLALEFGLVLSAFSFVLFASLVNLLTALLALSGGLFYTLVYTSWLKRSTVQNIVIGGAAGAIPPLVGWAAQTGNVTVPALFLFLIVFLWTPPHFWALALLIKREYAAARIPMLPVVRGDRATAHQIFVYALVLTAATAFPYLWGGLGTAYLVATIALDAVLLLLAWRLRRDTSRPHAVRLFHYSLLYLAILFVAIAVDPLI